MSNSPTDNEPARGTDAERDTRDTRDTRETRDTLDTDMMKWVSAIVALAGLGLVAYPFMFESTDAAMWNDLIVGSSIFVLGAYNYNRLSNDKLANVAVASLAALLGLWALISPAMIEMGSDELAMTTAAGGLITAALSTYSAYANRKANTTERTTTRA